MGSKKPRVSARLCGPPWGSAPPRRRSAVADHRAGLLSEDQVVHVPVGAGRPLTDPVICLHGVSSFSRVGRTSICRPGWDMCTNGCNCGGNFCPAGPKSGGRLTNPGVLRTIIPYKSIPCPSAPPGVRPAGEDRKPGESPGRYRRCQRVMPRPSAKAGHWGDLRRQGAAGAPASGARSQKTCLDKPCPSPRDRGGGARPEQNAEKGRGGALCPPGPFLFRSAPLTADTAGKG